MGFPAGCYWYGDKKQGPGHLPRWFKALCEEQISEAESVQFSSLAVQGCKRNNLSAESATDGSTSKDRPRRHERER